MYTAHSLDGVLELEMKIEEVQDDVMNAEEEKGEKPTKSIIPLDINFYNFFKSKKVVKQIRYFSINRLFFFI